MAKPMLGAVGFTPPEWFRESTAHPDSRAERYANAHKPHPFAKQHGLQELLCRSELIY